MTAPDPLALHGYRLEVTRHRENAERALRYIAAKVEELTADPDNLVDAQRLVTDANELVRELSALKALADVAFLTADQAAEA